MSHGVNPIGNFYYQQKCGKLLLPNFGKVSLYTSARHIPGQNTSSPIFEIRKGNKVLCSLQEAIIGKYKAIIEPGQMLDFKKGANFELVEVEHAIINLGKKVNLKGLLADFTKILTKIR